MRSREFSKLVGPLSDFQPESATDARANAASRASKNLSAYLAWFRFFDQAAVTGNSRQFLLDAFGVPLAEAILVQVWRKAVEPTTSLSGRYRALSVLVKRDCSGRHDRKRQSEDLPQSQRRLVRTLLRTRQIIFVDLGRFHYVVGRPNEILRLLCRYVGLHRGYVESIKRCMLVRLPGCRMAPNLTRRA